MCSRKKRLGKKHQLIESQSNRHLGCKIQTPRHYQFYFLLFRCSTLFLFKKVVIIFHRSCFYAKVLSNLFFLVFKVELDRL